MASSPYADGLDFGVTAPRAAGHLVPVIRHSFELAHEAMPSFALVKASPSPESPPHHPFPAARRAVHAEVLTDMGDWLSRNALLLSNMTETFIQSDEVSRLNRSMHERCRDRTTMADIKEIATQDAKFTRLRKIRDLTAQFSREVQAVWHPEAPVSEALLSPGQSQLAMPLASSRSLFHSGSDLDLKPFRGLHDDSSGDQPDEASPKSESTGSDDSDSDDDDEQFQQIDMNALRQRGRGSYYCPKGIRCEKGGVDDDGNLKRFDRNSSFIQHARRSYPFSPPSPPPHPSIPIFD
jgi:hypothetical protein